jgi:hypothetical protein
MPRGGNQARAAKRRRKNMQGQKGGPGSSHVGGKKRQKEKETCRFGCGVRLMPGRKATHERSCSRNPVNDVKR